VLWVFGMAGETRFVREGDKMVPGGGWVVQVVVGVLVDTPLVSMEEHVDIEYSQALGREDTEMVVLGVVVARHSVD